MLKFRSLLLAALVLPAIVYSRPMGTQCVGLECNFWEVQEQVEREPQPDNYAVALYDRATQFEQQYNKMVGQLETLSGSGRANADSLRNMKNLIKEIHNIYFKQIMEPLNQQYPFIENTDTPYYKNAISQAAQSMRNLRSLTSRLIQMIQNEGHAAGVYNQLYPERASYMNNLSQRLQSSRTASRPSTDGVALVNRLMSLYGNRGKRNVDFDEEDF